MCEVSLSYPAWRDRLLRCLRIATVRELEDAVRAHARGLKYRFPQTHLDLAWKAWKEGNDAAGALAHLEEAVALAPQEGPVLRSAGVMAADLPGGTDRGRELLRAAVAADPLAFEPHQGLAALLPPEEADRERLLGEALRGEAAPDGGK